MAKKKGVLAKLLAGIGKSNKKSGSGRKSGGKSKSSPAKARSSASKNKAKNPSKKSTGKSATSKNISKRYPNGRTLETKDRYLPTSKGGKSANPKEKRRVAIIDSNRKDELSIVRLTTKEQKNTTKLPTYKKGNKKKTFFKHFVEIKDNDGKPIKVDGEKFKENPRSEDLSASELKTIRDTVFHHVKQSSENNKKIRELKQNGDKKE